MQETRFNVAMSCGGCAAAVRRILGKIDGIDQIDVDVKANSVVVQSDDSVAPEIMLEKLSKWGKASGRTVELVA